MVIDDDDDDDDGDSDVGDGDDINEYYTCRLVGNKAESFVRIASIP